MGNGRGAILALDCVDPVLSIVGSVAMASAVGTALVVDLADGPRAPDLRTLGDLYEDGPTLSELSPGRTGVAVISSAGLSAERVVSVVADLAGSWPAVVVRRGPQEIPWPTVPLVPLYPGLLTVSANRPSVWQPTGGRSDPPGPGPVLPPLRRGVVRQVLGGRLPAGSRWVRAWDKVWDMPWA